MAKLLGNDYRLWIESSTPGTYNEIKGQQSLTINRQSAQIDTSTKDDFPYGTNAPGLRSLTVDFEMIPNLPDANGFTRFETQSKTSAAIGFQIRKGGAAGADPADVVFEADMYIGNYNSTMGQNDAVKATSNLTLASPPTVDELA
jgi:hypothetical protein